MTMPAYFYSLDANKIKLINKHIKKSTLQDSTTLPDPLTMADNLESEIK